MTTMKYLLIVCFIFATGALRASDVYLTSASISGYGSGTEIFSATGTNGTYTTSSHGASSSLSSATSVTHVTTMSLITAVDAYANGTSQCVIVIPSGVTATVSYFLDTTGSSASGHVTIGSNTIYLSTTSQTSGSVTLSAGTYTLLAYAASTGTNSSPCCTLSVSVNY